MWETRNLGTIRFEPDMNLDDVTAAIYFHIEAIKSTDDLETIKVCLDCIHELIGGAFNVTNEEITAYIKDGVGIFSEIRKKCIDLWVL